MIVVKKEWGIKRPVTISIDCSLEEAIQLMVNTDEKILVIVDNLEQAVGYVLERDLLRLSLELEKDAKLKEFRNDFLLVTDNEEISNDLLETYSYFFLENEGSEIEATFSKEEIFHHQLKEHSIFLESSIEYARFGIISIDEKGRILLLNRRGREIAELDQDMSDIYLTPFLDLYDNPAILDVLKNEKEQLNQAHHFDNVKLLINRSPVYHEGNLIGAVSVYEDQQYLEEMSQQLEYVKNLNLDLKAIVDSIYDEILVVDNQGVILRVSKGKNFNFWGMEGKDLVGESVIQLEEKGYFTPSVTKHVLKKKEKVSIIQENHLGKKILAVGNPIFSDEGELERVIIASRDITEISELKQELHQAMTKSEMYQKEVEMLKSPPVLKRDFVFQSSQMRRMLIQVEKVAKVNSTALIYGESGVGKEVIAENIHYISERRDEPFVKVNCGAIPGNLLESELFGYEKGAFTGALTKGKKGLFELADKGTLFLDEIGEMPLNLQVKLLQAIQDQKILRVGGTEPIKIDIRIVAATNKVLEEMVENKTFREDLYYRLAVILLYVPSLRERTDDIEPIALHFLKSFYKKYGTSQHFSEDALDILRAYHWPGNVRELQNIVERAVVTFTDSLITAEHLSSIIFHPKKEEKKVRITSIIPLKQAQLLLEEQLFTMAIKKYSSTTKIAQALEVSQPTAWRKIQEMKQK